VTKIEAAIIFAIKCHEDQKDKSGAPYILHPIRVMLDLLSQGFGEDVAIAGLFHDIYEDCIHKSAMDHTLHTTSFGCLVCEVEAFGQEINMWVVGMTKDPQETYREYIRSIGTSEDQDLINIKLADLRDNMRPERAINDSIKGMIKDRYEPAMAFLKGLPSKYDE
jgi:(p)ppGpp synthase/HD superfamily hydrolase